MIKDVKQLKETMSKKIIYITPFYISNAHFILLRMISNNYVCILILFFYCLPILDNLIHLYAKDNYLF